MATPIIHFDYDFSPYGQKTKLVLESAGIGFKKSDQPTVLPRQDLEALGITFRRIPLLAIGKDIYCDSGKIIETIITKLDSKHNLPTSPVSDPAYQAWGDTVFQEVLSLVPTKVLTPDFVKDRETVFPILNRPDLSTLRPSSLAAFRARLHQVEHEFLGSSAGPFIGGAKISLADIHSVWSLRWALNSLGAAQETGFGKADFPKVWRWIESLPVPEPEVLSAEETHKLILASGYSATELKGVQEGDPLGIAAGTPVTIESFDSKPGAHPQAGKLVASGTDEVVLELENGIRLHFPRIGYIVRPQ